MFFFFLGEEEKKQKKKQKTSWLGGRQIDSKNLSSSKDLLVRNVLRPLPSPPEGGGNSLTTNR